MMELVYQEWGGTKRLVLFAVVGAGIAAFVIAALLVLGWAEPALESLWPIAVLIVGIAVAIWAFCLTAMWIVVDQGRRDAIALQLWFWAAEKFETTGQDITDILLDGSKVWPTAQFWMLYRFVRVMFVFRPNPNWRYGITNKTRAELVRQFCEGLESRLEFPRYQVKFSGMEKGYFTNGGLWITVEKSYLDGGKVRTEAYRYYEDPYTGKKS